MEWVWKIITRFNGKRASGKKDEHFQDVATAAR
jgi:hypothetical protein